MGAFPSWPVKGKTSKRCPRSDRNEKPAEIPIESSQERRGSYFQDLLNCTSIDVESVLSEPYSRSHRH